MNRRQLLSTALSALPIYAIADMHKVQSLSEALHWLDQLEKATAPQMTGAWALPAVLEHLAQSIEMSMDGFPAPKSALFQATVGNAAFAVFKWRGQMTHSLSDPIPGAPPLTTAPDMSPPLQRLRAAITRFNAYTGTLKPHFAYGALSKADFALAHAFHIANHQDEVVMKG
jgi:hypothetical protein